MSLPGIRFQAPANDPLWINADNLSLLTQILHAQRQGHTCLPTYLGLSAKDFHQLLDFSPSLARADTEYKEETIHLRGDLRQQLLDMRRDEWSDLCRLLVIHRHHQDESEVWIAQIVAAACLGSGHLWRDLGMTSREQLRQLLNINFPVLVQRNNKDMRWKKFLYKQLCEQEGSYVCRSPTCETCPTYHECFGDES